MHETDYKRFIVFASTEIVWIFHIFSQVSTNQRHLFQHSFIFKFTPQQLFKIRQKKKCSGIFVTRLNI